MEPEYSKSRLSYARTKNLNILFTDLFEIYNKHNRERLNMYNIEYSQGNSGYYTKVRETKNIVRSLVLLVNPIRRTSRSLEIDRSINRGVHLFLFLFLFFLLFFFFFFFFFFRYFIFARDTIRIVVGQKTRARIDGRRLRPREFRDLKSKN